MIIIYGHDVYEIDEECLKNHEIEEQCELEKILNKKIENSENDKKK